MPNIWMNCEKHRKQIQKYKNKNIQKKKVQTWEKTTKEQQIKKRTISKYIS